MAVGIKIPEARSQTTEVYLGFKIAQLSGKRFVAVSEGWSGCGIVLEAATLPGVRKRIWSWWHHLLD